MTKKLRKGLAAATLIGAGFGAAGSAQAIVVPRAMEDTPGIEYSYVLDLNSSLSPTPGQTQFTDGEGSSSNAIVYPGGVQIDALANQHDYLFDALLNNQAVLLAGTQGDTTHPDGIKYSIMSVTPGNDVQGWALPTDFNAGSKVDVDALEVWGANGIADADMFSTFGDSSGTAVWYYNSGSPIAWFTTDEIRGAIDTLALGGLLPTTAAIDLDAMIVDGNRIIFSIRAIGGYFDGGELFVWNRGDAEATFLNFAGSVWNTAHDAGTHLKCRGAVQEIDTLEVVDLVPEPATMATLGLGAAGLFRRRRKV